MVLPVTILSASISCLSDLHQYFRIRLSNDPRFNVLASFCEYAQKSLAIELIQIQKLIN